MSFVIDSIAEGKDGYIIGFRPEYPTDPAAPITKYTVKGIVSLVDHSDTEITMKPDYAGCDDAFVYISASAITAGAEAAHIQVDDLEIVLVFADSGSFSAQIGDKMNAVLS